MEHKKLIGDRLREVYRDEYVENLFTMDELLDIEKHRKKEKGKKMIKTFSKLGLAICIIFLISDLADMENISCLLKKT